MKRLTVAVVLGLAAALAAAALLWMRERPRWTTRSAAALAAFEKCLDAQMKLYHQEAVAACQQAVELDPDFAVARLTLALAGRRPERLEQLAQLRGVDLERLTARERFLIRHALAEVDEDAAGAGRIRAEYLLDHPRDPYALEQACLAAWEARDMAAAESCYRRLLEVDPNWVQAQNHLGYLAMAQGRFSEAEDHFATYRFIAPDQANPYDSMGELLTLLGRYEEAEASFEDALAVRAGFCPSYLNLVRLYLVWGRIAEAERTLGRLATRPECTEKMKAEVRCSLDAWSHVRRHEWEAAWQAAQQACIEGPRDATVLGHEAAARTGRLAAAVAIEERFRSEVERAQGNYRGVLEALQFHMEATRAQVEGRLAEAAAAYRAADERLRYWSDAGLGIFKLYNELAEVRALVALGRSEAARQVMDRVRAVNPRLAAEHAGGP